MEDDYINALFGEEDPVADVDLYNNVEDYYNNTTKNAPSIQSGSQKSAYTSLRNLIRKRANSTSSYVKTLMGAQGDGDAAYSDNLMYADDGGYQKTPNLYSKTPVTAPLKGPYGQVISAPSGASPIKRPFAPGGVRTPTLQSNMGQTRETLRMADAGYNHDRKYSTVEYMDEARRSTFVVSMGAKLHRRGKLLDTAQVKRKYGGSVGTALTADGATAESQRIADKWRQMAMIWVCSSSAAASRPVFYSGVGKVNKVHHSSFTGGSQVVGAGEWIVENGRLMGVSAVSGHYMPTWQSLFASVLHMTEAFHDRMYVLMYNTQTNSWEERTVREFISAPSGGGRYKVHPRAM